MPVTVSGAVIASVTENPDSRAISGSDLRDGRGEHRFGGQQAGAHAGPLRTLAGEHPHRPPIVLPDRGLVRSVAVGDLAQTRRPAPWRLPASTAVRTGRCARRRARV